MNEKLLKYLNRSDSINRKFMIFAYASNLMAHVLMIVSAFATGSLLRNSIEYGIFRTTTCGAMIVLNIILLTMILKKKNTQCRKFLLLIFMGTQVVILIVNGFHMLTVPTICFDSEYQRIIIEVIYFAIYFRRFQIIRTQEKLFGPRGLG